MANYPPNSAYGSNSTAYGSGEYLTPSLRSTLRDLIRDEHIPVLYDVLFAIQKWDIYRQRNLRPPTGAQVTNPTKSFILIPSILS